MIEPQEQFNGLQVTINTNEDCNLACKYCYEINKKHKVLPLEYAKKFIDLILADPDPVRVTGTDDEWMIKRGLVIDFIGGDALMHPDLIDQILEYFVFKSHILNHRWKDNWRASLSTNGTLFERKEVRDLLIKWKENLSVGISIDGCPSLHNLNRIYPNGKGSFDKILEWWPWFCDLFGLEARTTKSTLNKESIPYLFESLKYLHEDLGIRWVNQNFIMEDMDLGEKDLALLEDQVKLCVDYVFEHRDDLYWSFLEGKNSKAKSFEENCKEHPNKGWCGSGAMPALSVEGKIYPCFRFLPITQKERDLNVGDIWSGFSKKENFELVRSRTREIISPEKCRTCEVESICPWCIGGCYALTGELGRFTYICEVTKLRHKYSVIYWNKVKELS